MKYGSVCDGGSGITPVDQVALVLILKGYYCWQATFDVKYKNVFDDGGAKFGYSGSVSGGICDDGDCGDKCENSIESN